MSPGPPECMRTWGLVLTMFSVLKGENIKIIFILSINSVFLFNFKFLLAFLKKVVPKSPFFKCTELHLKRHTNQKYSYPISNFGSEGARGPISKWSVLTMFKYVPAALIVVKLNFFVRFFVRIEVTKKDISKLTSFRHAREVKRSSCLKLR